MNSDVDKLWQEIKTQRDELNVRAHLAKAELKDELEDLEHRWREAEKSFRHMREEAKEATAELKSSSKVVLEELSVAYSRIKERLGD